MVPNHDPMAVWLNSWSGTEKMKSSPKHDDMVTVSVHRKRWALPDTWEEGKKRCRKDDLEEGNSKRKKHVAPRSGR